MKGKVSNIGTRGMLRNRRSQRLNNLILHEKDHLEKLNKLFKSQRKSVHDILFILYSLESVKRIECEYEFRKLRKEVRDIKSYLDNIFNNNYDCQSKKSDNEDKSQEPDFNYNDDEKNYEEIHNNQSNLNLNIQNTSSSSNHNINDTNNDNFIKKQDNLELNISNQQKESNISKTVKFPLYVENISSHDFTIPKSISKKMELNLNTPAKNNRNTQPKESDIRKNSKNTKQKEEKNESYSKEDILTVDDIFNVYSSENLSSKTRKKQNMSYSDIKNE